MPLYLISIKKRNWDQEAFPWLRPNQVPADVFQDLRITESSLSVWHVEDDRSNLNQVITALAATRQSFAPFDYGLFDQAHVSNSGITAVATAGETPMPDANHWHRDLIELTVDDLATLSKSIFYVIEKGRKLQSEIQRMIVEAAKTRKIDVTLVGSETMKQKITEHLNP